MFQAFVVPIVEHHSIELNKEDISIETLLNDGDEIGVCGITMKFQYGPGN